MQRDAAGIEAQRERFFCVNQYLLISFFYQCGVDGLNFLIAVLPEICLLYTSPSPRDRG